jgi:hypothetical protein
MSSKKYQEMQSGGKPENSTEPKHKQLIQMLSFRVIPAYFKEIEKVADEKGVTVSKLIRGYIKEGMKRDGDKKMDDFRIE